MVVRITKEMGLNCMAELCHEQWSHWMRYLFSKCTYYPDGTITIPFELANRWIRQSETPYSLLPLEERQSDKEQAMKFIELYKLLYNSRFDGFEMDSS